MKLRTDSRAIAGVQHTFESALTAAARSLLEFNRLTDCRGRHHRCIVSAGLLEVVRFKPD